MVYGYHLFGLPSLYVIKCTLKCPAWTVMVVSPMTMTQRQTVGRILAPTAVATTASFAPPSQCNAGSAKVFAFFPSFCFDFVHNTNAALHSYHQFATFHLKHLALCSLHDMSTK